MKPDIEQEKAAKYIDNHSLIVAGAGSGKTTTLLFKIENLINSGVNEKDILVISFTNETVNNFKNKCKYNVDVMTFHKLANKIINDNNDIVGQELLEECIKKYFEKIPIKLQKKIYNIFYYKIYTRYGYQKKISTFTTESIINYYYSAVKQFKANDINFNDININIFKKNELILLYCLKEIIKYYNDTLKKNNLIDFDDLIIEATNIIKNNKYNSNYKHILVDEYQDISKIRLEFLKALIYNNNSILTAVGDDFQSIYGFSGSNINLFYNFKNHFKNCKIFYINTSYRCPKKNIKIAGKFIMKNPLQLKKHLKSNSNIKGKIVKKRSRAYKKDLEKILNKYRYTNYTVLIIGRNNFDINFFINSKNKITNSYITMNNVTYYNMRYLTIHKSKGLEADIIIIINLSSAYNGFPRVEDNELIKKTINNPETYKYAEERRLFYVALTRSKFKTYLLIDKLKPSEFISEI